MEYVVNYTVVTSRIVDTTCANVRVVTGLPFGSLVLDLAYRPVCKKVLAKFLT